mmetsp:Transcript_55582/g.110456  ORF Transcript_55582/g.110456 Transcript_55582/m.110456 type:complete len:142 (-) Transcript_55582:397-822(-)
MSHTSLAWRKSWMESGSNSRLLVMFSAGSTSSCQRASSSGGGGGSSTSRKCEKPAHKSHIVRNSRLLSTELATPSIICGMLQKPAKASSLPFANSPVLTVQAVFGLMAKRAGCTILALHPFTDENARSALTKRMQAGLCKQ